MVEKDALQGYLLEEALKEAGWKAYRVENPEKALWLCEHNLFDVALINAKYPGGTDGLELGQYLANHYALPSLMITASRYTELERNRYFSGRQEILFKPYLLQECLLRLQDILSKG